jgi:hypothetical protein
VANTVCLACDHYDIQPAFAALLEALNGVFTWFFVAELFVCCVGLGLRLFLADPFHRFDALVVAVSLLDFFASGLSGVNVLRAFRLLRVFKLLKSWVGLRRMLAAVLASVQDLTYFAMLACVFVFCYTIVGKQYFAGLVPVLPDSRASFDTFGWSALAVFQVVTGENWNVLMALAVKAVGWSATLYFVSLYALALALAPTRLCPSLSARPSCAQPVRSRPLWLPPATCWATSWC